MKTRRRIKKRNSASDLRSSCRFEALEPRNLLAVTFTTEFIPPLGPTILRVAGDGADDTIVIGFTAQEGFKINDTPVFPPGFQPFVGRVEIRSGGGQDTISIEHSAGQFNAFSSTTFLVDGQAGFDNLTLLGTSGVDVFDLGANGINMNDDDVIDMSLPRSIESFTIDAGAGADTINGQGNRLVGAPINRNVRMIGGLGNDTLLGGTANDALFGQDGSDTMSGGEGNDKLDGGNVGDTINGDTGNDTLIGGGGNDRLFGGEGDDTLKGGDNSDIIQGDDGNDTLNGDAGNDSLAGGEGADGLFGGVGNDTFNGGFEGNPDLINLGVDQIDGGAGIDEESFGGRRDKNTIRAFFDQATNQIILSNFASNGSIMARDRLLGGIEKLTGIGGLASDTIDLSDLSQASLSSYGITQVNILGGPSDDTIDGTGGRDIIHGDDGNDLVFGNAGNDQIFGDAGDDNLSGNDGNDTILGGIGKDRMTGGAGADQLIGNEDADVLEGSNDNQVDTLEGNAGNDVLFLNRNDLLDGGVGGVDEIAFSGLNEPRRFSADRDDLNNEILVTVDLNGSVGIARGKNFERLKLIGGSANDFFDLTTLSANDLSQLGMTVILIGHEGNDEIRGSGGNDRIDGGDGDDLLLGAGGNDTIFGGFGNDTLAGSAGNDFLFGGSDDDTLNGGDGDDELIGDSLSEIGADRLNGGAGADKIDGGKGDDILTGGTENDFIEGGEGNDNINGNAGDDELHGEDGDDNIKGEDGDDQLFGEAGNDTLDGGTGNNSFDEGPGQGGIVVQGTAANDVIRIGRQLRNGLAYVVVTLNGNSTSQRYTNGETIIVHAGTGHDSVVMENDAGKIWKAEFFGEAGNDQLHGGSQTDGLWGGDGDDRLFGEGGNDILQGAAGNDWLFGGSGLDLLFGGFGSDRLYGGLQDDLIVTGATQFDADRDSLNWLNRIWTQTSNYDSKVVEIITGSATRPQTVLQRVKTVFDDGERDYVFGGAGHDLNVWDSLD